MYMYPFINDIFVFELITEFLKAFNQLSYITRQNLLNWNPILLQDIAGIILSFYWVFRKVMPVISKIISKSFACNIMEFSKVKEFHVKCSMITVIQGFCVTLLSDIIQAVIYQEKKITTLHVLRIS